ncbi:MAG: hypothetical protein SGPRY_003688 [Prymnesium sp.]
MLAVQSGVCVLLALELAHALVSSAALWGDRSAQRLPSSSLQTLLLASFALSVTCLGLTLAHECAQIYTVHRAMSGAHSKGIYTLLLSLRAAGLLGTVCELALTALLVSYFGDAGALPLASIEHAIAPSEPLRWSSLLVAGGDHARPLVLGRAISLLRLYFLCCCQLDRWLRHYGEAEDVEVEAVVAAAAVQLLGSPPTRPASWLPWPGVRVLAGLEVMREAIASAPAHSWPPGVPISAELEGRCRTATTLPQRCGASGELRQTVRSDRAGAKAGRRLAERRDAVKTARERLWTERYPRNDGAAAQERNSSSSRGKGSSDAHEPIFKVHRHPLMAISSIAAGLTSSGKCRNPSERRWDARAWRCATAFVDLPISPALIANQATCSIHIAGRLKLALHYWVKWNLLGDRWATHSFSVENVTIAEVAHHWCSHCESARTCACPTAAMRLRGNFTSEKVKARRGHGRRKPGVTWQQLDEIDFNMSSVARRMAAVYGYVS